MVLKNDYKRIRRLVREYEKECSLLLDQTKHSNTIKKAILEKNSRNVSWVIDYYIKQGYKGSGLIKILEREFAVSKYEMIDCYSYLDAAYMAVFEMYKKEFPVLDDLSEEGKKLFFECFETVIKLSKPRVLKINLSLCDTMDMMDVFVKDKTIRKKAFISQNNRFYVTTGMAITRDLEKHWFSEEDNELLNDFVKKQKYPETKLIKREPYFSWADFKKELDSFSEKDCLFFPEIKDFKNELNKLMA